MTNNEIKDAINKAFEKITDTETLKQVAVINNLIDQKEAEDKAFLKQHVDLANEYKKVVVGGVYKANGSTDESGAPIAKSKSFEECIKEVLSRKG